MTIRHLMNGASSVEIVCRIKGTVVRRLTSDGNDVIVDAITEQVTVPLDTRIVYEPWFMDRGSLLFNGMKLCTEGDIVRFPDGSVEEALPC